MGLVGEVRLRQDHAGARHPGCAAARTRTDRAAARLLFDGQDLLTLDPAVARPNGARPRDHLRAAGSVHSLQPAVHGRRSDHGAAALEVAGSPCGERWLSARASPRRSRRVRWRCCAPCSFRDPEQLLRKYPHELSGGQRQRVMIAMALLPEPKLVIADEPTTALDVTIQAQILKLLRRLATERGVSVLFATHDLGTAWEICDRVTVMYAGQELETAPIAEFFRAPMVPYTRLLLDSLPSSGAPLRGIAGDVPSLIAPPNGCRFHPRCPRADDACRDEHPAAARSRCRGIRCAAIIRICCRWSRHERGSAGAARRAHAFPDPRCMGPAHGWLRAVDGVSLSVGARRDPRRGGRIRLRQDHAGQDHRRDSSSRAAARFCSRATRSARCRRARAGALRRTLQYCYQDPGASLDPHWKIGRALDEPLVIHTKLSAVERRARVREVLAAVGLPETHLDLYPHEISGGQQRRVGSGAHPDAAAERGDPGRADVGTGRVGAGDGAAAVPRTARTLRSDLSVHQPRPRGGASDVAAHCRDVSRQGRWKAARPRRSSRLRAILIRSRCWQRFR